MVVLSSVVPVLFQRSACPIVSANAFMERKNMCVGLFDELLRLSQSATAHL